jgi:hypothetical protein
MTFRPAVLTVVPNSEFAQGIFDGEHYSHMTQLYEPAWEAGAAHGAAPQDF